MLVDAIAIVILTGMMFVPLVNVLVGAIVGSGLGGIPGCIAGIVLAIVITLGEKVDWRPARMVPGGLPNRKRCQRNCSSAHDNHQAAACSKKACEGLANEARPASECSLCRNLFALAALSCASNSQREVPIAGPSYGL